MITFDVDKLPEELKNKAKEVSARIWNNKAKEVSARIWNNKALWDKGQDMLARAWLEGFVFCLQGKVTITEDEKDKQISKLKKALHDLVYATKLGKNELATARIASEAEELLQEIEK